MGFPRQEYWSGLLLPSLGDLADPGMEPELPVLQADSLPSQPMGKSNNSEADHAAHWAAEQGHRAGVPEAEAPRALSSGCRPMLALLPCSLLVQQLEPPSSQSPRVPQFLQLPD